MSALSPLRASLLAAGLFLSSPLLATDAPSWNVNQPQGPLQSINIDVTQGTWMNVDISPDGTTLVFDLLGDIYQMPIDGGEATPLIQGIAWHMQPRFSPDGNYIAFTSDQDGGDNIWIMNADGSEPRPVSSENFRLLNSPAWSPDSQYLVGRKHYTAQRSLGAGEVWMYHVQGGDGIQLTERPNDQKDLGEPAFSPDGRYLYFSQDATPGKTFHYSKDSVQGIYKIKRYDRHSGDIEVLLSGTGGAIRPTPSPDGKTLAYISRDGFQTSLYLYDLQSGQKRKIYDRLDRDMQETWAIHGVYPTLAWTPDNQQLLFWAGGQIHKLNVHSGVSQVVPFHVATDKQVQPAVRFSQQLDPDQFDVKMLRQVQVSPDGNTVVFEALGKLWQRPIKGDKPQRVTTTKDGFELFPQFSRDGKHLVFASWQDDQQGAIKVINLKRGKVNTLTTLPGKYVEPTFSPDGRTVVYRKVNGGYITPATWDNAPGIYRVSAEGGTPLMISDWGTMPHFGHRNDRLFLTTRADDKPALASVNLDGFDRRTHFTSDHATEFHVSPDGNKLAFAERFKVFLTPFASHGETQHIGPNGGGLPVKQLSQRAGENLSWNLASTGLYWSLGPELYQANVEQLFDPSQPEVEPASVTDIGFQADTYVPRETIAFVGGQVITMNGDHIIQDGVVIVEDNRITAVGSRDQVSIPAGTRTIDIEGKTLMPGLFDAHAHGSQGNNEIIPEQNRINFASLALGVTSIHDPSNDTTEIFAASELQKSGDIIGPRIFSTGTILYGANGPGYTAHVDSLEDAKFHLERLKKVGAFSVKSYNQPRRNQRQQIIAAARELEMMVVPEGGSLLQHNLTMIADGHTGIEHALPAASIYDDIKQFWSQTEVGYTPTLVVAYGGIWGENYWYDKTEVWKHPRLSKFVPQEILRPRAMRRTTAPDEHYNHFNVARVANELRQLGISSNIGAHGQRESLGAHWEIWMFAQGGMSNLEALKTATINPARHFAMDQQIGSIETGKLADLIVIDGDPLANIRDSDKVHYTMVGGRLYDAATMNELNGKRRQRAPFYFE
ncbi:amidohydrolase family protein [Ferrimonas sp. SCSIO 43195]|uniref:amidohydrolase family protein n=1 Tax=Ferrimonas sp. SCSIO 43195 TaxID=2822844 RepID=UPI002074D9CE|nr:amidohydrolase family protein [Ferrimonas sp. SCSIO 43195]USD37607.1 PD40 domain-containing protein [Ferrimonas sp. SCSIO 43195]